MKRKLRFKSWHLCITVGAVTALACGIAAAKQPVNYADSNDLILAAMSFGLAHPPGYPLLIVLLGIWMRLLPFLTPVAAAGWFTALLMGISTGLLSALIIRMNSGKKVPILFVYVIAAVLPILWILVPLNWTFATVPEIMPLALIMTMALLLTALPSPKRRMTHNRWLLIGFIGTLAGLYHPLLAGVTGLVWIGIGLVERKTLRRGIKPWIYGMMLAVVTTALGYIALTSHQSAYSWEAPQTVSGWWQFWTRQVYTDTGSAIEQYSRDYRLPVLIDSVRRWGSWWVSEQDGAVWLFGAFAALMVLFVRKKWMLLTAIFVLALGYGPGLALYLKHPASYQLAETALWWGVALRERMFYLWPLLLVVASSVALTELLVLVQRKSIRTATVILVLFMTAAGWSGLGSFLAKISGEANAASLYHTRLLSSLPERSVLIVDSDDVFGILLQQIGNGIRQDVTVIPAGMILQPQWWSDHHQEFSRFGFSPLKSQFVADIVSTSLPSHRVFLYGADEAVISYLGLEGNPWYAVPYGYSLEIQSVQPIRADSYDYGLSVQLASIKTTGADNWFKGFRTNLGTIHTQQAYFFARSGMTTQAAWQQEIAKSFFYTDGSRQSVDQSAAVGAERFSTYGSYVNYKPQTALYWKGIGYQAGREKKWNEAEYALSRSLLVNPLQHDTRLTLAAVYDALGKTDEARYERQAGGTVFNSN